jgi:methylated-DNA-[protein]-cysteine S-methyltransferase/AraC family transcriptional regulator of adaptative response/methylated-DNA-[protein]-cysteine methyltransferase
MNLMITQDLARATSPAKPIDILLYATASSVLGEVLIARSAKGVCAILIGDSAEELAADLASRFPQATPIVSEAAVSDDLVKLLRFIENPAVGLDLPLDMRGTPFQRRVWEKLKAIPPGRTVTYREMARWISPFANPRAVGSACAANPIALAIPCHRVVRSDGDLAGYRWGIERKRALIEKEAMA